jgi:hypothetical protein
VSTRIVASYLVLFVVLVAALAVSCEGFDSTIKVTDTISRIKKALVIWVFNLLNSKFNFFHHQTYLGLFL